MFASRTNWRLDRNHFTQALERHRCSGKKLFDLTVSNPTECATGVSRKGNFRSPRQSANDRNTPRKAKVCARLAKPLATTTGSTPVLTKSTCEVDPENILLTSGTSEGYSHIFRLLCEPGDEVLVPAPSYPLFEFLADLADVRLISYPLFYDHGWQIDFDSLRSALTDRSRAVLVVHPNNPTGSFVKPREAAELAQLCAARGMAIVADEVFLDYADQSVDAGGCDESGRAHLRDASGCAHFHAQRIIENFLAPANEAGLDRGERAACAAATRRRTAGSYRGHVSVTGRGGTTGLANVAVCSRGIAKPIAAKNLRESRHTGRGVA